MNTQINQNPAGNRASKPLSRLTFLQAVIIASAAVLGSMISFQVENQSFGVAELLGSTILPFVIGMAAALSLKRWRGTMVGIFIIAAFFYFICSAVVHDRREQQKSQPAGR